MCLWLRELGPPGPGPSLCLAAAPHLLGGALVVGRILEGRPRPVAQGRTGVVGRALVPGRPRAAARGPVVQLPVRMVAVIAGGLVVRVVGAGSVVRVRPVLGAAVGPVVATRPQVVHLPVLVAVIPVGVEKGAGLSAGVKGTSH